MTRRDDNDYLQLEGNGKKGWSSLRYCEIEWMSGYKDKVAFARRPDP